MVKSRKKPSREQKLIDWKYNATLWHVNNGRRTSNGQVLDFAIKKEEFATLCRSACWYCGDHSSLNGLDRIDSNKGYTLDNVIPCCSLCNSSKGKKTVEEFLFWCKKISDVEPPKRSRRISKRKAHCEQILECQRLKEI